MSIIVYRAETTVLYRGFLIRITVRCGRDEESGLRRQVRGHVLGYLPDVFAGERVGTVGRKQVCLDGEQVEIVSDFGTDIQVTNKTYLEQLSRNATRSRGPVHALKNWLSPPAPTPLSEQVAQVLESVQADVDQYLEDHMLTFDAAEFQHGLSTALAEQVAEISVSQKTPTDAYDDTPVSVDRVVAELDTESDAA